MSRAELQNFVVGLVDHLLAEVEGTTNSVYPFPLVAHARRGHGWHGLLIDKDECDGKRVRAKCSVPFLSVTLEAHSVCFPCLLLDAALPEILLATLLGKNGPPGEVPFPF
jgi:hypothetical protein